MYSCFFQLWWLLLFSTLGAVNLVALLESAEMTMETMQWRTIIQAMKRLEFGYLLWKSMGWWWELGILGWLQLQITLYGTRRERSSLPWITSSRTTRFVCHFKFSIVVFGLACVSQYEVLSKCVVLHRFQWESIVFLPFYLGYWWEIGFEFDA